MKILRKPISLDKMKKSAPKNKHGKHKTLANKFDRNRMEIAPKPKGRKLKFESPEKLAALIEDYFTEMRSEQKPITVSGLAVYLGTTRQIIQNYAQKDEYYEVIQQAKAVCEAYAEECLYGNNVAGVIFSLKNNFGWKDTQDKNVTIKPPMIVDDLIEAEIIDAEIIDD